MIQMDHEALGRAIIATGSVSKTPDERGWRVQKRYSSSTNYVRATSGGLRCDCQPSYYHNVKCQHIWAVEIEMANRGESIVLPERFDEEAEWLNNRLRESERYELVLHKKDSAWFIDVGDYILPITEWRHASDITTPIEMILARARETKTKLYIEIDHTPYDYTYWIGRPNKPLGVERVLSLLQNAGFSRVRRRGKLELLIFDPTAPVDDPYAGIPGHQHLKRFIERVEGMLQQALSPEEYAGLMVDKREFLQKMRDAQQRSS